MTKLGVSVRKKVMANEDARQRTEGRKWAKMDSAKDAANARDKHVDAMVHERQAEIAAAKNPWRSGFKKMSNAIGKLRASK